MKNISTISLPEDLKAKAKANGKYIGVPALSTYIHFLIEMHDKMLQDEKINRLSERVPTEAQVAEMERAFKL